MKKLFLITLLFHSLFLFSQETVISNTTLTTCDGVLLDTGMGLSNYSPDENFTMVICSGNSTLVNLSFSLFNLGLGDSLVIYDGNDINAPILGAFVNNELSLQNVTSTNADGCLTLVFTSDGSGEGNFSANISCEVPCVSPQVIVIANELDTAHTIYSCPNESVFYDASETLFDANATITDIQWDFGDGTTDNSSWPTVEHTYSEPGGYLVSLNITVDNDCSNTNSIDILVLVSTYPVFSPSPISTFCLGEAEALLVDELDSPIESELYDFTIDPVPYEVSFGGLNGDGFFIPDGVGVCFSNDLEVSGFAPGSTITTVDMIEDLYINFEHSWMGDLTISFICPNNQSITVHQQGGGGTFLGIPIDPGNGPGTGFDYWWAPDAPNGTWAQASNGVSTLPSGIYSSNQSFNNLIGCPINGTWTLQICDGAFLDDGYIFNWAIDFDPSLYPDYVGFEPVYGQDCDSTYFSSDYFVQEDDCSLTWNESITEPGDYPITITTTNDFGCSFTDEISISILGNPEVEAGDDVFQCGDDNTPLQLNGELLSNDPQFGGLSYEWSPTDYIPANEINTLTPTLDNNYEGNTWYVLSAFYTQHPQCVAEDSVQVVVSPTPALSLTINGDSIICSNATVELAVNDDYSNYIWDNTSTNSNTYDASPGTHTVIAYNDENCQVSSEVSIASLPETTFEDHNYCFDLANNIADNPISLQGQWSYSTDNGGDLAFENPESNTLITASDYGDYTVSFTDECGIVNDFQYVVHDAPDSDVFTIENEVSICSSELPLSLEPNGQDFEMFNWSWNTGENTPNIEVNDEGVYSFSVSNECGSVQDTVAVQIYLEANFLDQNICNALSTLIDDNEEDVTGVWGVTSTSGGNLSFDNPSNSNTSVVADTPGTYHLTFTDNCNQTDEFDISFLMAPNEDDFIDTTIVVCQEETPVSLSPNIGSVENFFWNWSTDDTSPIIDVYESGSYTYTASNSCGSVGGVMNVNLLSCALIIPNIFTPDQRDTLNNSFVIDGLHNFPNSQLTIFNRWGNLVYQSNDYKNDWSPKAEEVADGTYYYLLQVPSQTNNSMREFKGYVQILR